MATAMGNAAMPLPSQYPQYPAPLPGGTGMAQTSMPMIQLTSDALAGYTFTSSPVPLP